jgi:hypothetical protein
MSFEAIGKLLYIIVTLILGIIVFLGSWFIYGAFRRLPLLYNLRDSAFWKYDSARYIQKKFGNKGLFIYYVVLGIT